MRKTIISWMLLFACNLMWSLQFTCIKLTQDQVGPYFTVWAPMLLATLFLTPFALRDLKKGGKKFRDIIIFGQLALLGVFPAQVLMTWGTQYSLASNAAILTLCLPVVTAIFAFLLLNEKMNFGSKYAIGNILIFIAIVGNAYYNTGIKKIAARYTEIEMVFFTYLVMVILLTPLVIYYEPDIFSVIPSFTKQTWIGMGLLTFFHNFLSMILFFKALKVLDAMQVALSNYMIAFFGLPIAAIWLGERLNSLAIAGGILVLISTLIITIVDYRMTHPAEVKTTVS